MWCSKCRKPVEKLFPIDTPLTDRIKVKAVCHGEEEIRTFATQDLLRWQRAGKDVAEIPAFEEPRKPKPAPEPVKGNPVDALLDLYRPGWRNGPGNTPTRRLQAVKGALAAQRVMLQCASAVQMQNGVLRSVLDQLKAAGLENEYARKVADQLHAEFATVPNGEIPE